MGSAHQVRLARGVLAEAQQAVGDRAVAHLVIEARDGDIVGGAERAVGLHPDPGHDEERDPSYAGRRVGELREDEVDDILRDVLIAARDPHLAAGEPIGAVAGRDRPAPDVAQRGAHVGLREAHRAEETPGVERLHVKALLLVGSVDVEQIGCRLGQHQIADRRRIGRLQDTEAGLQQDGRKLHAAPVVVESGRDEARVSDRSHALVNGGWHAYPAVL